MAFSFDGFGVNGADEYRSRLATLTEAGKADNVGPLLAAAPELLQELRVMLTFADLILAYRPAATYAIERARAAIAKVTG